MKSKIWQRLVLGIFAGTLSFSGAARATISGNLSANSEGYEIYEYLESYGCALPIARSVRPMSMVDLRDTLVNREDAPCTAPEWLLREANALAAIPIPPELRARAIAMSGDTTRLVGLDASVTPLYPFRRGLPFFEGTDLYLEMTAGGSGGADLGYAYQANLGWALGFENYQTLNGRFYLREGVAKLGYRRAEVAAGRMQLKFGDAKHGDMALSLAFRPLDALRFSVRPHVISGLEFLGYVTFDTWLAGLGTSATPGTIQDSQLWGVTLAIRPAFWLELSVMEVFQFGGTTGGNVPVTPLEASDVLAMFFYGGGADLDLRRQRSMAAQIGVWLPSHFAKLYGQFFFDGLHDFKSWFADDVSTLTGLWVPNFVGSGLDFRFEYAHTVPAAYRNSVWPQGLASQGSPFGSPLGANGRAIYFDVGFPPLAGWRPSVGVSFESRQDSAVGPLYPEERYTAEVALAKRWEKTSLRGTVACTQVDNQGYVLGSRVQNCAAQAQLSQLLY